MLKRISKRICILCSILMMFQSEIALASTPLEMAKKSNYIINNSQNISLNSQWDDLITEARKYVNKVPYVYGGNTTNGWDCSGFICNIYNQFGINLWTWRDRLKNAEVGTFTPMTDYNRIISECQPGDILIFSSHVAIYSGNGKMIHALNQEYGTVETDAVRAWTQLDLSGYLRINRPTINYHVGWDNSLGYWRYSLGNGNFATDWKEIDGYWYYFYPNAAMASGGFLNIDNATYYFDQKGKMQTGWQTIYGDTFYFSDDGTLAKGGWIKPQNDWYYVEYNGALQKNKWIDNYYVGNDGAMLHNVKKTIDGVKYSFDSNGNAHIIQDSTINNNGTSSPDTSYPTYTPPENTETEPVNPPKQVEYSFRTRTQDYEYTTSSQSVLNGWEFVEKITGTSGEWNDWSSWSENYIEETDKRQVQTRKVSSGSKTQIYLGRYYSESSNDFSPSRLNSSYSFEGGWFDEDKVTFVGQAYAGGRNDCYKVSGYHYYFFEIGSNGGERREISLNEKTEYRYREQATNVQYRFRRLKYSEWSDWSNWSTTPIEANDLIQVRTR